MIGIGRILGVAFDVASEAIDTADARRELRREKEAHSVTMGRLNKALTRIDQLEMELEASRLVDKERRTTASRKETDR